MLIRMGQLTGMCLLTEVLNRTRSGKSFCICLNCHFVFVSIVILYLYERGIQTEILSIGLPFLRLVYVLFNFLKRLDKKEIT